MRSAVAGVAAALALAAPAGAQAPPVATVDGAGEVTRAQFEHWARIAARTAGRSRVPRPGTAAFRRIREQVTVLLVQNLWLLAEAEQRGLVVTAERVRRAFVRQKRAAFPRPGAFGRFLRRYGYTIDDLLLRVRLELTSTAIRRDVVRDVPPPTPEEVRAYYEAHRDEFVRPERRRVRLLAARSRAAAAAARRAIARGLSFARAARLAGVRARTVSANEGTLHPRLDRAVFRAPRGRVRGPLRAFGRWYVFRVVAIRPERLQPLERAAPAIGGRLTAERQQQALGAFIADFRRRWRAATACRVRYAAGEVCGRIVP
jgi:parvulin-like peptidyl-prolyl isomerase